VAAIRYRPPLRLLQPVEVRAGEITNVDPTFRTNHIQRGGVEPSHVEQSLRELDVEMPLDPHVGDQ
jgi:hypothetical protein